MWINFERIIKIYSWIFLIHYEIYTYNKGLILYMSYGVITFMLRIQFAAYEITPIFKKFISVYFEYFEP